MRHRGPALTEDFITREFGHRVRAAGRTQERSMSKAKTSETDELFRKGLEIRRVVLGLWLGSPGARSQDAQPDQSCDADRAQSAGGDQAACARRHQQRLHG